MIIKNIVVGLNEANCYILVSSRTKEAVIIDPGAEPEKIKKEIADLGVTVKYIINTHGHADHISANKDFSIPILIHRLEAGFLANPYKNMSVFFGFWIKSPKANRLLEDGDKIIVGDLTLEIMHTPGHTPGGICIKVETPQWGVSTIVFTGDTLFGGSVGRTDLPGSSEKALYKSIKSKLLVLDDDVVIYPGHGSSSTIGIERKTNPYLLSWKN